MDNFDFTKQFVCKMYSRDLEYVTYDAKTDSVYLSKEGSKENSEEFISLIEGVYIVDDFDEFKLKLIRPGENFTAVEILRQNSQDVISKYETFCEGRNIFKTVSNENGVNALSEIIDDLKMLESGKSESSSEDSESSSDAAKQVLSIVDYLLNSVNSSILPWK